MSLTPPLYPSMSRPGPLDAVSPAFARTNAMLLKPFRLVRSWKLATMSYLSLMGCFFLPLPLLFPVAYALAPRPLTDALPPNAMTVFAIGGVLYTVVLLGLFYLGIRLELVQFEMIVTMADRVGPMWRRQGPRVWPWLSFKVAVGTAMTALLAPVIILMFSRFITLVSNFGGSGRAPAPETINLFLAGIFSFYAVLLGVLGVFLLVSTLLNDFVLPFYELEGLTVGAAVARGWKLIVAEPLQMALYLVVKAALGFMGYVAAGIVAQICAIPIVIVICLGALGMGLTSAHGQSAPSGAVIVLLVVVGVVLYAVLIALMMGVYGCVMMMLDAYALYFVGTRYPALGELMNPTSGVPPTFTPPPPQPSPDEEDDDGPTLPMDPALA